jgi:hypothetical protein
MIAKDSLTVNHQLRGFFKVETNSLSSSKKVRKFIAVEEELSAKYNRLKRKRLHCFLLKTGIPPPIKPLIAAFSVLPPKKI